MTDTAPTGTDAFRTGAVTLAANGLTKTNAGRWDRGRRRSATAAVADVDLELRRGTISGLVGQSGSGKSTIAKLLALLERRDSGTVRLDGEPGGTSPTTAYRRAVQMVFQDPFASLNPAHTIGYHLSRPLRLHHYARTRAELRSQSIRLLEQVKLRPAEEFLPEFPHQLSGGERQRVAIALALAVRPQVLLADEPVSMLDVSIRAGLLNLLRELADTRQLAVLYITHDIASAVTSPTRSPSCTPGGSWSGDPPVRWWNSQDTRTRSSSSPPRRKAAAAAISSGRCRNAHPAPRQERRRRAAHSRRAAPRSWTAALRNRRRPMTWEPGTGPHASCGAAHRKAPVPRPRLGLELGQVVER